MNRKQRRATRPAGSLPADSTGDQIKQLLVDAAACERLRKFDDAVRHYKRVLQLKPDHAEVCNNLGRVLLAQGKPKDASAYFARSLALMPQLLKQYAGICATLVALLPPAWRSTAQTGGRLAKTTDRERAVRRRRLAPIADNPLLLQVCNQSRVQDIAFERLLTALRRSLLSAGSSRKADFRASVSRFRLRPRATVLHQ